MSTALAEKIESPSIVAAADVPDMRRFEIPDLDRHQTWFIPRLRQAYPTLNDRTLIGWLRAICYSSEFKFLYQDHAVALFQSLGTHTLQPQPVIHERFVFIDDPKDVSRQQQAAEFYVAAKSWAEHQGAAAIVVEQNSDVPHEMIRDRMGRLLNRQEWFYKVS